MLNLGDSILFKIGLILLPTFGLLIGTALYSYMTITRYSKTIKRLYKMNFNSLEFERKRISNDLHDQLGSKMAIINRTIDSLSNKLNEHQKPDLNLVQSHLLLFHNDVRKILEAIHPRDLMNGNWQNSVQELVNDLCIDETIVQVEFHTAITPKEEFSYHLFRIIQEKLSNIFAHTKTKRIQIVVNDENNYFQISIIYKHEARLKTFLTGKIGILKGRGELIIKDRLKIIGGKNKISYNSGYISDLITIPHEHFNT